VEDYALTLDRKSPAVCLPIHFPGTKQHGKRLLERMQDAHLPAPKADVNSLKRELERVYQIVKTTCGERREQTTPALSVGMVIRGR
jgi:hypothetical protein